MPDRDLPTTESLTRSDPSWTGGISGDDYLRGEEVRRLEADLAAARAALAEAEKELAAVEYERDLLRETQAEYRALAETSTAALAEREARIAELRPLAEWLAPLADLPDVQPLRDDQSLSFWLPAGLLRAARRALEGA